MNKSICSPQGSQTTTISNGSNNSYMQNRHSQSLITKYFGRQLGADHQTKSRVNIEWNILESEMLLQMIHLDNVEWNDENVDTFLKNIEQLQSKMNIDRVNTERICAAKNVSRQKQPAFRNVDELDGNFADVSLLPIYYNNVRCITNKRNICMKIELSFYKVLCFTETWLTNNKSSSIYFPKKFNVYRHDRPVSCNPTKVTRRSGGVAVIVHSGLISRQLKLKHNAECECLAIEIAVKPSPLILYVLYMREFDARIASMHFERISELMSKFHQHRIMILGDFNLHDITWRADETNTHYLPTGIASHNTPYYRGAAEFLNKLENAALYQLSNVKNAASNVLDLLFMNEPNGVKLCEDQSSIIESGQQDAYHKPYEITFEYSSNILSPKEEKVEFLCYQRGNYQRMCLQLDNINFAHEFGRLSVNSAFEYFHDVIDRLIKCNIPKITINKNSNRPKWWTRELQKKKNRRDKLYKRKPKGMVTDEYVVSVNEFNALNDRLHKEYIDRIQKNIASNPSEFWNFAKLNCKSSSYPNEMHYDDRIGATPKDIVELFADHFEETYITDNDEWNFSDIYQELPTSKEINVSLFDIEAAVNSLKWKSGCGPDEFSPFVIKMCIEAIVWPIWLLFKKTFDSGLIPEKLKMSRVVPVFKKGDKADVRNYRIVAISSVILKIFERAMKFKLTAIIEPHLSNAQHGFRAKRSVTTNLLNLSISVHEAFEKGRQLDVFYGDFKNAFDRVWHRRLVEKLRKFNIGTKTAKWLCEFVIGRTNFVRIGNNKSRIYASPSGVPAGSTLGTILFLVLINDLEEVIEKAKLAMFADDVKIMKEIVDTSDTRLLQNDINNIIEWCATNRLYFNNLKCAIFTASRSNSIIKSSYAIGEHVIERKDEIRDLGVLVDQRFSFNHHIEQITAHARQMIGYIKRVSNGNFTLETKRILYLAYVRSRLEFASVIWSPHQTIYMDDIESVQKQFVIYLLENRKCATSFKLSPYYDRCKILNIEPLNLRRRIADALFVYDVCVTKINDVVINSKFIKSKTTRTLRKNRWFEEPRYKNEYSKYKPIARMLQIANKYSNIIEESKGRKKFRKDIERELNGEES